MTKRENSKEKLNFHASRTLTPQMRTTKSMLRLTSVYKYKLSEKGPEFDGPTKQACQKPLREKSKKLN